MFRSHHQQTPRYWPRVHNWVITRRKYSIQSQWIFMDPLLEIMEHTNGHQWLHAIPHQTSYVYVLQPCCHNKTSCMQQANCSRVFICTSKCDLRKLWQQASCQYTKRSKWQQLLNCPSVGPLENQRFQWAPAGHDGSHVLHVYNMPHAWYCKFGPKVTTMHNMPPNCYLVRLKQPVFC